LATKNTPFKILIIDLLDYYNIINKFGGYMRYFPLPCVDDFSLMFYPENPFEGRINQAPTKDLKKVLT
jgi:hypothetical protein